MSESKKIDYIRRKHLTWNWKAKHPLSLKLTMCKTLHRIFLNCSPTLNHNSHPFLYIISSHQSFLETNACEIRHRNNSHFRLHQSKNADTEARKLLINSIAQKIHVFAKLQEYRLYRPSLQRFVVRRPTCWNWILHQSVLPANVNLQIKSS